MFMRYRGGGIGHLGTRCLDSRLKEDNFQIVDGQQDGEMISSIHEDSDSYPHEGEGDSIDEDPGMNEERTSIREPHDKEDDHDDADADEEVLSDDTSDGEDPDDEEKEAMNNEQDLDNEDEEATANDDEILEEEGYAEL
jgi:hypothetical protein